MDVPTPTVSALIADADPSNCRVLQAQLTKDPTLQAVVVSSGAEAFRAARRQPFDVVLWDERLRDPQGLLPQIRALCPLARFCLMTTDNRSTPTRELSRFDVVAVVRKPFEEIGESIHRIMQRPLVSSTPAFVELTGVGQLVTIESPQGRCLTRVLESSTEVFRVMGGDRVQQPSDFTPGLRVQVHIKGEDALYRFASRLRTYQATPFPLWELTMPRTIHREQRRQAVRVPLRLPVTIQEEVGAIALVEGAGISEIAPPVKGFTEDISLLGCALVSQTPLEVGTLVHFGLLTGEENTVNGLGRVLRLEPLVELEAATEAPQSRFRIALQFTSLSQPVRRHLRSLLRT